MANAERRPCDMRITTGAVRLTVILAAMVLAASCSSPKQTESQKDSLDWGSCQDWVHTETLARAQCSTLTVPVNWAKPTEAGAEPVRLAVLRLPATGSRIGTLFVNPGGPGSSAIDFVERYSDKLTKSELNRRFDIIAFDPRGVGFSTPLMRCRTDAEMDADRADSDVDDSQAGVVRTENELRDQAQECADKMGTDFLASMSTTTTARDMDAVRSALGEQQLSYLGFSYGTRLGTAYADQFPDRVRAMVLDGVVDQNADPLDELLEQSAGFQKAFDAYAADCATSPSCPLGTDPAKFSARYREIVDPLVSTPGKTADPRGLSYGDAVEATVHALYNPENWPTLTDGLRALTQGGDVSGLLEFADENSGRDEDGHYSPDQDAFQATHCVDQIYPDDPAPYVEVARRSYEVAPFWVYKQFTGFAPRDLCTFWPVKPASAPQPPVSPGPGKVVVVSTTGDPATPYQVGVDVAAQLGAPVITFVGSQHAATLHGSGCVDDAVNAFLIDLKPPPPGLRC